MTNVGQPTSTLGLVPALILFLFPLSSSVCWKIPGIEVQSAKRPSWYDPYRKYHSLSSMADEPPKPKRAPGARPDRVRLVVLLYRKKELSIEDFQSAWYASPCRLLYVLDEICAYVVLSIPRLISGRGSCRYAYLMLTPQVAQARRFRINLVWYTNFQCVTLPSHPSLTHYKLMQYRITAVSHQWGGS